MEKQQFDVTIEIISPIIIKYKVWAENEKEAKELIENGKAVPIYISKPRIVKNNIKKLSVYISGTVHKLLSYIH